MQNKTGSNKKLIAAAAAATVFVAAAAAATLAPTGEQSKLAYPNDIWCVSNYIEQEPQEIVKGGNPRQDKLLDGKENLIRRDQVKATSKAEAEKAATRKGFFEPSDKTALRNALSSGDQKFFTKHFNAGATIAGVCVGNGQGQMPGMWVNDMIRAECLDGPTAQSTSSGPTTASSTGKICTGAGQVPEAWAKIFEAAGEKFGVHPAWIAAIFATENGIASGRSESTVRISSTWPSVNKRNWATSNKGANGPMQFLLTTWASHKQDGNGDGVKDVQNVWDAIFGAAHYIKNTAGVYNNIDDQSLRRSAISYVAGPGNANKPDGELSSEARTYIIKTRAAFKKYNCAK